MEYMTTISEKIDLALDNCAGEIVKGIRLFVEDEVNQFVCKNKSCVIYIPANVNSSRCAGKFIIEVTCSDKKVSKKIYKLNFHFKISSKINFINSTMRILRDDKYVKELWYENMILKGSCVEDIIADLLFCGLFQ